MISISSRTFFPTLRASLLAGVAVAALFSSAGKASAQDPATPPGQTPVSSQTQTSADGKVTTTTSTTTDANGKPVQSVSTTFHRGKKQAAAEKDGKSVQTKDTKKALRNEHKVESLANVDSKLPDKQLFDKAVIATNKGHFDVARLDLQTMLNTYPNSEYQMRAKLAVADSWYKEGGTAALTQAESEYRDFVVFFPNVPEAAEAQMRIGDIYFKQMDRPDRDYAKALHAEEEYRRMLTDYPNSTLVPQAKQRLRDVQEVLATREATIAAFYATRDNYAAEIARYQTVVDTYPLYSHMDDVLIGLGDAYESEARFVRTNQQMPEAGKARLEELYDGEAAACYKKVVLEHSAAPHVEDAKDRLAAMSLPIPTPTQAQLDASVALENSRSPYKISDYISLLILHKPDTVLASHIGDPPMVDVKPTVAPTIIRKANDEFRAAYTNTPMPAAVSVAGTEAPAVSPAASTPAAGGAPLALEEVPTAGTGGSPTGSVMSSGTTSTSARTGNGAGMNVEIITHDKPSTADPALKVVRPNTPAPLPDAEDAAPPPDVPNQVNGVTPAAQTPNAKGKNKEPALDKKEESSSKKKKKTGLDKINPF